MDLTSPFAPPTGRIWLVTNIAGAGFFAYAAWDLWVTTPERAAASSLSDSGTLLYLGFVLLPAAAVFLLANLAYLLSRLFLALRNRQCALLRAPAICISLWIAILCYHWWRMRGRFI
jgi:hypothetical protein